MHVRPHTVPHPRTGIHRHRIDVARMRAIPPRCRFDDRSMKVIEG